MTHNRYYIFLKSQVQWHTPKIPATSEGKKGGGSWFEARAKIL
jgi:hypothetical protein